jgi:nucleotide-binding universal stress UspA family protein
MVTFLVLVDGSNFSDRALDYVLGRAANAREPVRVHLLNVQVPVTGVNVKLFVKQKSLENYYREEGMKVLEAPRRRLQEAGIEHDYHIGVGEPGPVAVAYARDTACCQEIVMGTHGRGFLSGAVMGSVAQKVAQLSPVPVVLVK